MYKMLVFTNKPKIKFIFSIFFILFIFFAMSFYFPSHTGRTNASEIQSITLSGSLELLISDNFEDKTTTQTYILKQSDGTVISIYFNDTNLPVTIPLHTFVTVHGIQDSNGVIVEKIEMQAKEEKNIPHVEKKTAFILFNFHNDRRELFNTDFINRSVYTNVDSAKAYYMENSYNELTITGDIFNWITIPDNSTSDCNLTDLNLWTQHARTITENLGIDLSMYDNFFYVLPAAPGCNGSAFAYVGGNEAWLIGGPITTESDFRYNFIHEFGHNLSFKHANTILCYDSPAHLHRVPISADCTNVEYGDPFDPMGLSREPYLMNNYHKLAKGWIPVENMTVLPFPNGLIPTTETLYPIETSISHPQVIRIFRNFERGQRKYYYLEYRQPYGFDTFSPNAPVVSGINIRISRDYVPNVYLDDSTQLIDNHPETDTFDDSSLLLNESFNDPVTHLNIRTVAVNSLLAQVQVSSDCVNPFIDILGNTFYNAIHYFACQQIINGTDYTHFSPAASATRAQFAKAAVLSFGIPDYSPPAPTFSDVPPSYFAYQYIENGVHAGILNGFDEATCSSHGAVFPCYLPNQNITREQVTKIVVAAAQYPIYTPPNNGQSFTDVPPSNIFFTSIETAAHVGVIRGYLDHTFQPHTTIRRDEMAQIIYTSIMTP